MSNVDEISSINFGILSPDDYLNMSCAEINNIKRSGEGSVYDSRLGTIDDTLCETCKQISSVCPGHFGHIVLNEYIINPLYYKRVGDILSCICLKCNKMLLSYEQMKLLGYFKCRGEARFKKITDYVKKSPTCFHCNNINPVITVNESVTCTYKKKESDTDTHVISTQYVYNIFSSLSEEEIEYMGFSVKYTHPRNFIFVYLPVIPISARPYIKKDGSIYDDDFTNQLIEIIKANNKLENKNLSESEREKLIQTIIFRISTTFNNSKGKAKYTTSNRPIKSIKSRISGKMGQLRNSVMAKRCEQSGRTVVTPSPYIKIDEVGVPMHMCKILSVPEVINDMNRDQLQNLMNTGKINFLLSPDRKTKINIKRYMRGTPPMVGDTIKRGQEEIYVDNPGMLLEKDDKLYRNGKEVKNIEYANRFYELKNDWIAERNLQDGDYVLLNRQPTLHKGSIQAFKVKPVKDKTLRVNLAVTKAFNMDFDGDEGNIHVPQTLEARVEARDIMSSISNIISEQSSKPNIAIVQDGLLGAYMMSNGINEINKENFFDIMMRLDIDKDIVKFKNKCKRIRKVMLEKKNMKKCYTGKGLISMILPDNFNYEKKNDATEEEPTVRIYKGVLYEGVFDKSILGASHNSIIQVLAKEYDIEVVKTFINGIQIFATEWLLIKGFSIGIKDCVQEKESDNMIKETIYKCFMEANQISAFHPGICEMKINAALGKAREIGLKIAKESFKADNNFIKTVQSGSKGDYFNIAQISGLLGQQNIKGARIPYTLNNNNRSMYHYPLMKEDLPDDMKYESQGFISSSFIKGLNPREFYMHAMAAREGMSDTAMGTASSGYIQRKISSLLGDIKIEYDYTVRDSSKRIFQFSYGNNNIDPAKTIKVNGKQKIMNIHRIVDKLNLDYEEQL